MGPLSKKAAALGGSLRLEGKREKIEALLKAAIDKPCTYCGTFLTYANASLDHMEPLRGLHRASGPMRASLDRISNLQIVCRQCNTAKSDMNDSQFRRLLAFLRSDPAMYEAVWPRLRSSGFAWAQLKSGRSKRGPMPHE